MDDLLKAGKDWTKARKLLLDALKETDKYLKDKNKTKEVVEPLLFIDLWTNLSKAESTLENLIMKCLNHQEN